MGYFQRPALAERAALLGLGEGQAKTKQGSGGWVGRRTATNVSKMGLLCLTRVLPGCSCDCNAKFSSLDPLRYHPLYCSVQQNCFIFLKGDHNID